MKIQNYAYLNQGTDVGEPFHTLGNIHYHAQKLEHFDADKGRGVLLYGRFERKNRISFNMYSAPFEPSRSWTFPPAYPESPTYPFSLEIIADNVFRLRTTCREAGACVALNEESPMLANEVHPRKLKPIRADEKGALYRTEKMTVEVQYDPFHVIVRDSRGKELTKTLHASDSRCLQNFNPLPFSHVRSCQDMRKYTAVSLQIHPNEHFYGCGESFTKLDKMGQRLTLWTKDANSAEGRDLYKPIPFFISSRGYGAFYHTSCPMTLDFGHDYAEALTSFSADENVDMFFFVGDPKEVLGAYTDLTGKSPLPPLWSFGLWMSRISYRSEEETREVVAKLKEHRVPCDVIHLDTGWFEQDWLCDYRFSESRFEDAEAMIADLRKEGYRISLWQLPYFTPKNPLFKELVEKKLVIQNAEGALPTDDAILDFSNPEAVAWYAEKIAALLKQGVAAIKTDFGEAAPLSGLYHAGRSGLYEHNLYPLRYNKAAYDTIKSVCGDGVVWARSAWAGSQRYPLHWGGDCENTDMGMLATLRGGLSFGASGFSYWSHDVGGFVHRSPEELYERWTFMGIFTSHMRCHGQPPKEPWAYSERFLTRFREMLRLRYALMPYIWAQSMDCSEKGLPLLRAMFIEYPHDPTAQGIEDQYFFGNDILVAPLFEAEAERCVYLPQGRWVELGTNTVYESGWHTVKATVYPGLAFVRGGARIPMVEAALNTDAIRWETMRPVAFEDGISPATGLWPDLEQKKAIPIQEEWPYDVSTARTWACL